MISLRFGDFRKWQPESEENFELYVVRNPKEILYIGISRHGIWNRWFHYLWGHFAKESTVASRIRLCFPASEDWVIELWTIKDCHKFLKNELKQIGKPRNWTLETCEQLMIRKLHPILNIEHNQIVNAVSPNEIDPDIEQLYGEVGGE